jgi:hypothetical protein
VIRGAGGGAESARNGVASEDFIRGEAGPGGKVRAMGRPPRIPGKVVKSGSTVPAFSVFFVFP